VESDKRRAAKVLSTGKGEAWGPNDDEPNAKEVPPWTNVNRLPDSGGHKTYFTEKFNEAFKKAKPEEIKAALEESFGTIDPGKTWKVATRRNGNLLAWKANTNEYYQFDCLLRLRDLFGPDERLEYATEPNIPTDAKIVTFQPLVSGILELAAKGDPKLKAALGAAGKVLFVLRTEGGSRQLEQLIVQLAVDPKKEMTYEVLWLPFNTENKGWDSLLTTRAFGEIPSFTVRPTEYEFVRSCAWFPDDPAKLTGGTFSGFKSDQKTRVLLKNALAWHTQSSEPVVVWTLLNQNQARYVGEKSDEEFMAPARHRIRRARGVLRRDTRRRAIDPRTEQKVCPLEGPTVLPGFSRCQSERQPRS